MDRLQNFQHQLCMQAGAYQNGCWVVAVAKAGVEEGVSMIRPSSIITVSPGEVWVAEIRTIWDQFVKPQF